MIEIGEGEGPPVRHEIQTDHGRNVGKRSVPIVGIENISLVAAPGTIGTDEFVDGIPTLLVFVRSAGLVGGRSYNLPPEETVEILTRWARDHAVRDIEIGEAVVIEIERVARPRPAAHSDACGACRLVESRAMIPKQRIPHRMFLIESPDFL